MSVVTENFEQLERELLEDIPRPNFLSENLMGKLG
jgi:hypothetical protein